MPRLLACLLILIALAGPSRAATEDADRAVVGRFLLTDMNGRAVTDEMYGGKIRIVVFGYTYCPDICPTVLNTLSVALEHLGADRAKVVTLFVTVDPERDSPAHLKEYLASFPEIIGLTGSAEQIAAAARNFKVRYEKQPVEGNDPMAYSVDHSSSIYIMDRVGNFLARMPHASKPDRLAERVKSYLAPRKAED
ncbi:SCO family protein [Paramagnetospirillum kuznetsovii]|nr:SCO family protein [Paramagnetospirillum kuznetsovii]